MRLVSRLGHSFSRSFWKNLPAPFLQREVSSLWSRGHRAPAGTGADQLAAICGRSRSCFLCKKWGGGRDGCGPVLQSTGQCAEQTEETAVCSAVKKVEARSHSKKNQHLPSGSWTFLGGGCCYCFSNRVGTAPGYLCASTAWQLASPFLTFPFRKHPWKGNEAPKVSFSRSQHGKQRGEKFSGMVLLLYLLPWKTCYPPGSKCKYPSLAPEQWKLESGNYTAERSRKAGGGRERVHGFLPGWWL